MSQVTEISTNVSTCQNTRKHLRPQRC